MLIVCFCEWCVVINVPAARDCDGIMYFGKGWSSVTAAEGDEKGDEKGSIEAPFLSIKRIQTALIVAST